MRSKRRDLARWPHRTGARAHMRLGSTPSPGCADKTGTSSVRGVFHLAVQTFSALRVVKAALAISTRRASLPLPLFPFDWRVYRLHRRHGRSQAWARCLQACRSALVVGDTAEVAGTVHNLKIRLFATIRFDAPSRLRQNDLMSWLPRFPSSAGKGAEGVPETCA
jgi:hypothetical protein